MSCALFKRISVVGLGYIGLPTAAAFAAKKIQVIGLDINEYAVQTINKGQIHIVEPELDKAVHDAVTAGYLRATTRPEPADAFLIAVPTPFKGEHEPDLRYVEAAAKSIAGVLKEGDLVILESTSPVGTTEKISEWLAEARPDLTFPHVRGEESSIRIAYCPERVLPGHIMRELVENDRVIGGITQRCSEAAAGLYKIFVRGECVITNSRTAEMCKLTENSFRDVNIAFANELSIICDKLDIDVWKLIRLANRHPRVKILQPGPGVGGHCIAVDPWFIVDSAPDEARLIRTAREVNDCKPLKVVQWLNEEIGNILQFNSGKTARDITIAALGLTFKPNIDDMRESPALHIVELISASFPGKLKIVEPNISALPSSLNRHELVSFDKGIEVADLVLVLVAHREFQALESRLNDTCAVIDAVGITKSHERRRVSRDRLAAC